MKHIVYNKFINDILLGSVNLINDDIMCALLKNTYLPSDNDITWDSISSHEVSGAGYIAGGKLLQNKVIIEGKFFDADNLSWPNSSIDNARYIVLYNNTAPTPALIACFDLLKDKSTNNSDFTIEWDVSGILLLMQGV